MSSESQFKYAAPAAFFRILIVAGKNAVASRMHLIVILRDAPTYLRDCLMRFLEAVENKVRSLELSRMVQRRAICWVLDSKI